MSQTPLLPLCLHPALNFQMAPAGSHVLPPGPGVINFSLFNFLLWCLLIQGSPSNTLGLYLTNINLTKVTPLTMWFEDSQKRQASKSQVKAALFKALLVSHVEISQGQPRVNLRPYLQKAWLQGEG